MKNPSTRFSRQLIERTPINVVKKIVLLSFFTTGLVYAESLTLPVDRRPDWLRQEGIVMAGSWEPLGHRARRDGDDYVVTSEEYEGYLREHSPEMVARLKELGVNFVMTHCYKGLGLEMERKSMNDAAEFARLCHDAGLYVGVYCYTGAFHWKPFFKEVPRAKDWLLLDENGKPRTYGRTTYRYFFNRHHPEAFQYYKQIVRFAVEDIKADLLHFDNYSHAYPGSDIQSVNMFRQYLTDTFTAEQLQKMGVVDVNDVGPVMTGPPNNMLRRAWLDFSCKFVTDAYCNMTSYARTLRSDILVDCNPYGVLDKMYAPIDHGRLLQCGDASCDECLPSGSFEGKLRTRIRTYKVGRLMDNMIFSYTTSPLELAESMAFNFNCIGIVLWFEYGKIVVKPGSKEPMSPELLPFIRFFHNRHDLLRDADVIADIAVLRSFPSQLYADPEYAKLNFNVEKMLIENRNCFQIIFNQQLDDLKRYRALVLVGCVALSDQHVEYIKQYVRSGGRLCIIGPVATHDQWMYPRSKPALQDLPESAVVRIDENGDVLNAVRKACSNELSLSVESEFGLCTEFTKQPNRRLIHLVNYLDKPIEDAKVSLRLPEGRPAESVTLVSPEHRQDIKLDFEQQANLVIFTIPKIKIYEIAVVSMK